MNQTKFAIDTTGWSDDDGLVFIAAAGQALYSGRGAKPLFSKWLDLVETDAIRVLAGAPADWFTMERRQFFETVHGYAFDLPMRARSDLWRTDVSWCPTNPRASKMSIASSRLDLEFLDKFGCSDSSWEGGVFHTSGFLARCRKAIDSSDDRLRAYFGLSMLGIEQPAQFFCSGSV